MNLFTRLIFFFFFIPKWWHNTCAKDSFSLQIQKAGLQEMDNLRKLVGKLKLPKQ